MNSSNTQHDECTVQAEIGQKLETDYQTGENNLVATFNGMSRRDIEDRRQNQNLNLYQVVCKPRVIVNEAQEENEYIDMSLFSSIKEMIHCPVCFDILKEPLNVKMCLHKFCSKCIENYSRTV